jgi:hypothetical protein
MAKRREWEMLQPALTRMFLRILVLFLFLASIGFAAPRSFSSGTGQTALIELYTSEGCSSCPPAEQWLGELRTAPGLWRDFVPVAFHVNYWDRLGWTDRFASGQFTEREYALAAAWRSESVYTPCFVLNGREWRAGGDRPVPGVGPSHPGSLTAEYGDDGVLRVSFTATDAGPYVVTAAVLGGGIISAVRAGENDGRTLHHEFIVMALRAAPLQDGRAELVAPVPATKGIPRHALAVWITRAGDLSPVQATGGWID